MKRDYSRNIVVDYSRIHYNIQPGLTMDDHLRIASDLEKIARLPLLGKTDERIGVWNTFDGWSASLLVRCVEIVCDSSEYSRDKLPPTFVEGLEGPALNKLLGYHVEDIIRGIYGEIVDGVRVGLEEWYNDARKGIDTPMRHIGKRSFSLAELDKMPPTRAR